MWTAPNRKMPTSPSDGASGTPSTDLGADLDVWGPYIGELLLDSTAVAPVRNRHLYRDHLCSRLYRLCLPSLSP